jgi:hypothetical protein
MDGNTLGTALGVGLATGISTLFGITLLFLPASWVMNRFIYHSTGMRIVLGFIAAIGSIFSFAIILGGTLSGAFQKIHYFSLLPISIKNAPSPTPSGYGTALFEQISNFVLHPIKFDFDAAKIVDTMSHLLVDSANTDITIGADTIKKGAVYEKLVEDARAAGARTDDARTWAGEMNALTAAGQAVFTP